MHYAGNSVLGDNPINGLGIADIADNKRCVCYRLTETRGQIIQHNHTLAASAQLLHDVAADISGAPGD
jgi:hypothetical protein